VKAFGKIRILQIGPRPSGFWSVICNEGELIEKFGIQIYPISVVEIQQKTEEIEKSGSDELKATMEQIEKTVICKPEDSDSVCKVAALKLAMRYYVDCEKCTAVAIQCWNALQDCMHLMPCLANALLTDEGIPAACETDINGAVSEILAYAAALDETAPFLCDLTVRQTTNDNVELLTHCGNFPPSLVPKENKTHFGNHFMFDGHCPGTHEGEIKGGTLTGL
jgi:L-fucose isomerase-like protein